MSIDEHIFSDFVRITGGDDGLAKEKIRQWAERIGSSESPDSQAGLSRMVLRMVWDECSCKCGKPASVPDQEQH